MLDRLLLLFLILAISPLAHAAESLTLERAIEETYAHNPEFQRTLAAVDEAAARPLEALSAQLPKLSTSGSYLTNHKFLLFPFGATSFEAPNPITLVSFDMSLNVFDGFQTIHAYRSAKLISDATLHEAQNTHLLLENGVKLRFYQALSAQMLAEVADQNVKTLQDHLAKTKALLSGGASTKLDTLRVEVQLSEAMPDQIQARDNVVITRKALTQVMGLEDDNRVLSGELPIPDAGRLPSDLKLDAGKRLDLVAAQERAAAADSLHSGSYGPWIPHVSLQAEYQLYNNLDNSLNTSQFENTYSVGVFFNWTLFDAGNLARMHATQAQKIQAEKTAEAELLRAPVDFENWRRRFLFNVALYQARNEAIKSAAESVRLAHISYDAGVRTSTEVLDAELDLFRARAGAVRAQVDSSEALINLELALGHHI